MKCSFLQAINGSFKQIPLELCPDKPTIWEKSSKVNLVHLSLATEHTQSFVCSSHNPTFTWSCGYCHQPASQERIIRHSSRQTKDENPKHGVFLPDVYSLCTILKLIYIIYYYIYKIQTLLYLSQLQHSLHLLILYIQLILILMSSPLKLILTFNPW